MIDANEIASALGVGCMISSDMSAAMSLWDTLYRNQAKWQKGRIKPLRLPAVVSKEIKRLTLKEFTASIDNPQLDSAFQKMIPQLRRKLDAGLAVGGLMFKPYWDGSPRIDIVRQDEYLPISFTDDECSSMACPETITIGKNSYTRLEVHTYDRAAQAHTIENRCFCSSNPSVLGKECALSSVPQWAAILPIKIFTGVTQPLFAVFRVPDANNVDPDSSLGMSVFADAVDVIRDADNQWERILWELESSERAIDASEDLFRFKDGRPVLPQGRERMYHTYETTGDNSKSIFNTFSPEIRDTSYFHALNQMFRRVENLCGLAYGTISEVEDVEKTAEEIKSSKQRSYDRVHEIQENLRPALAGAVYGMQYLQSYYSGKKVSDTELTCTFGDGILEDTDKEFTRRMQMVTAGMLSKEQFVMWYFSCSEEDVRDYMPNATALFGGNSAVTI